MGDLKLEIKTKGKDAFTAADIKANWANKTTFCDHDPRRQSDGIWKDMRGMIKDRELAQKALKADVKLTGLPSDPDDYPGTHKMDVYVNGERACRMDVDIKGSEKAGVNDVGFKSLSSSEDAAKLLVKLKKDNDFFKKNLTLKKGDSQHPDNILWKVGSVENSLPMNAHTKGDGKKNEKVALDKLKKTMKALGYV